MIWRVALSAVVLFAAAALGTWFSDRDPPATITSVNVLTPVVRPGGELRIQYVLQRWRTNCRVHADRVIFDSQNASYPLPDVDFAASVSARIGDDTAISVLHVPPNMSLGPARYRSVTSFRCNPLHSVWPIVREDSEIPFRVEGAVITPRGVVQ